MANQEHPKILEQGVDAWNKWRVENPNIKPNLSSAEFCEVDLCEANLVGAILCESFLINVQLTGADLSKANLEGADLCGVDPRLHRNKK